MNKIIFIALLLLINLPLQAQIQVSAALDSAAMLIGDQTTLHLFANHPANATIQFPGFKDLGGFEIIELGQIDTLNTSPEYYLQQDVVISAFDSGFYQIPPQPFIVNYNGQTDTVYSPPLAMAVHWIEVDSTAIEANYEIKSQPFTKEEILRYVIGVVVIALVCALLFFIFTRKRKVEVVEKPVEIIPAHIIAQEKIEKLKAAKLWQAGEVKKYYSELTFIAREYLENRYGILALESTTDEILSDLKQQDFSDEHKQNLREILQSADLVKFAKGAPAAEFHENAMKVAEDFISKTKKVIADVV